MIDAEKRDRILTRVREAPAIMGILNLTPDSFSDGGRHNSFEAACAQVARMVENGADIIDVGGESTRPGASPVPAGEELARVLPVIRNLSAANPAPLSIDTMKSSVARAAVDAGAVIINDVTGMTGDEAMADTVAETGAAVVVTYHRGVVDEGIDAVDDMIAFFDEAFRTAARAGIPKAHIWLDPGIGFAKTQMQNLAILARLDELEQYDCPVLVGASRKSIVGHITGRPVAERLSGTLAAHLIALQRGARILRVHDVAEHRDAVAIWAALEAARRAI